MRAARPAQTLKAKALACIAQREHSRVELKRKLLAHVAKRARAAAAAGIAHEPATEAEVEALLDWLAARDLLSEARFVETRVQARAACFGDLRIRRELAEHGVALDDEALAALRGSELDRARAVKTKRFGVAPPADAAERAKQLRFLAARGFSAGSARKVLKGEDD
jgi:regulatory protein